MLTRPKTSVPGFLVLVSALVVFYLCGCQPTEEQIREDQAPLLTIKINRSKVTLNPEAEESEEHVAAFDVTIKRSSEGTQLIDLNPLEFHLVIPGSASYPGSSHLWDLRGACSQQIELGPNGVASCTIWFESPDGFFDSFRGSVTGELQFEFWDPSEGQVARQKVSVPFTLSRNRDKGSRGSGSGTR
jgi:hypothetical protein